MDLQPSPVELVLIGGLAAKRGQRILRARRCLRQHRVNRIADAQSKLSQGLAPTGEGRRCYRRQISGYHHRPPHHRQRSISGFGDRVEHDAGQGALAQIARQQPPKELLLPLGRGPEQSVY